MNNASMSIHGVVRVAIESPGKYDTPGLNGQYQRIKMYDAQGMEIMCVSVHAPESAILPPVFDAEEF
jgi:hypothetical protein